MNRKVTVALGLAGVAALGLLGLGIGGSRVSGLLGTPVTLTPARRGTAIEAVYASGTVEAADRVVVRARTAGTLELLVREGATVRRGDLLARVVNPVLDFDLERGRADLSAASAMARDDSPTLHSLEARVRAVQAELTVARQDLERVESLLRSNALPAAELDRSRAHVAQLEATLAATAAQQRSAQADLSANVARQGAQVKSLRSRSADSEVRSPMDGVVLARTVASGETVATSQPLLRLGDVGRLALEVYVDEADVTRVSDGKVPGKSASPAAVRLHAYPDRTFHGTVTEIAADATRERRAYLTRVYLDDAPEGLRSGMSAEVNVIVSRTDAALLVPSAAERDGALWVVENGRARARPVVTGIRDLTTVEIKSGLAEGELVLAAPPPGLREGAWLRGTPEPPSPASASSAAQASLR